MYKNVSETVGTKTYPFGGKSFVAFFVFTLTCFLFSCASMGRLTKEQRKMSEKYYRYGTEFLYRYRKTQKNKNLEMAIKQYKKSLSITPKDIRVYEGLGHVYMFKGDYRLSLAMFSKAIELIPHYKKKLRKKELLDYEAKWKAFAAELYNNRAAVLNVVSEWDKAIESCKEGLKYKKFYKTSDLLYRQMGTAYLSKKDFKNALESFSNMLSINPFVIEGYYFKGFSLSKLNRPNEAVLEYEKALELAQKSVKNTQNIPGRKEFIVGIHRTLGLLYYGLGNKAEAVRHMEEAYKTADKEKTRLDIKKYLDMLK